MKKTTKILIFLLLTSTTIWANDLSKNAFNYDEKQVQQEFGQLNNLEKFVNQHPDLNYGQLKTNHPEILQDINLDENVLPTLQTGETPLGIGSFWWGCCLGIWGILIVYLATDQDHDETKKAFWGCLLSAGVLTVTWLILVLSGTQTIRGCVINSWH